MATEQEAAQRAGRGRWVYPAFYAGYILLGMIGRWSGWQNGDQLWFVDAARHVLDGSWRIYEFRPAFALAAAPPLGVTYSYSSLLALVLAPFVALADALQGSPLATSVGGGDELAYRLIALPLLAGDVLAMVQFRRLVRAWRPGLGEAPIFLGIVLMLGLGFLQVSASHDHPEGIVLLFLLLTLQVTPRSAGWGGVWAGLALAAKQTVALPLLPVAAVLLLAGWQAGGLRGLGPALRWGAAALAVFAAFLLPGWLAAPSAAAYALLDLPQRLVLYGSGVPGWVDLELGILFGPASPAYALWHGRIIRYSNVLLVAVAVIAVAGAVAGAARHGRPIGLRDERLLALVAFGATLSLVLSKWIGSHYYPLPLALVILWDTVRVAPRWPLLGWAGLLGFRAITVGLPLPGVPIPRGVFVAGLCAWYTGRLLGEAARAPVAVPSAPSPAPRPLEI